MPNWCATNYCLKGDMDELTRFADMLNSMPIIENGFGRYWVGNMLVALGLDPKDAGYRATLDPDPEARAFFDGPCVDEERSFSVDDDGTMRFSIISAWDRCPDVEEIILDRFPSFEFFWKSTDEFGNFHLVHDPDDICRFERYGLKNGGHVESYGKNEFGMFREGLIKACPSLDIPADASREYLASEEFMNRFMDWIYGLEEGGTEIDTDFWIWDEAD